MLKNKTAVIYHYWNEKATPPWMDLENPVLLAIANFRNFHKTTPIYLIDASEQKQDWDVFPQLLNFEILHKKTKVHNCDVLNILGRNSTFEERTLERVFVIYEVIQEIPENHVLFVDCDIFWVQSPFPLNFASQMDKFCGNANSGLFYFNKKSHKADYFYNLWMGLILLGQNQSQARKKIIKHNVYGHFICESALRYLQTYQTESFCEIDNRENFKLSHQSLTRYKQANDIKNVHLCFGIWGNQRGAACKKFKDIQLNLDQSIVDKIIPNHFEPIWIRDCDQIGKDTL